MYNTDICRNFTLQIFQRSHTIYFTTHSPKAITEKLHKEQYIEKLLKITRPRPKGYYRTQQDAEKLLVEMSGFEPLTFRLQNGRSTN